MILRAAPSSSSLFRLCTVTSVLSALVALAACSSTPAASVTDAGPADAASDVSIPPPPGDSGPLDSGPLDASQPDAAPGACDTTGFVSVADDGFVKSSDGTVGIVSQTTLASPVDTLELDLLPLTGSAVTVGKRALSADDASYDTCKTCVLIRTKCDDGLANCAKTFMAKSGSVGVTTFGGKDGAFEATVDVAMVEVTIDNENKTTPVAGGKTWCLTAHKVSVAKLQ